MTAERLPDVVKWLLVAVLLALLQEMAVPEEDLQTLPTGTGKPPEGMKKWVDYRGDFGWVGVNIIKENSTNILTPILSFALCFTQTCQLNS